MSTPEAIATWFKDQRGIDVGTLAAFGVKVDRGEVILPYANGEKRRPDPTMPLGEKRRFYFTKDRKPVLFQPPVQPQSDVAFLVEGETDTMRTWQELGSTVAVFGLSGVDTWRPELAKSLEPYKRVVVILDNDEEDYRNPGERPVDRVWRNIRQDLPTAKRVTLPYDVKDMCEFWERYDAETLDSLCRRPTISRFSTVDFDAPVPPVRWVWKGWVAAGDVTLLVGKGGLGKSWVTMALANALLRGDKEFLGAALEAKGKVLYVDEENPLDVIHGRMKRLGLDPQQHAGNLRYLWNQHVRLDRNPEKLHDEALDYRPVLTVLDSLTRMHTKDENNNGEMSVVMNDGVLPIARDADSATVLIHHQDKGANGPRGAVDIENSADAVIQVYDQGTANPGCFLMRLTKSRRRAGGEELRVRIVDRPDGTVALELMQTMPKPF